jgi:site-specific DNA-methyltransferase (adenine-specific)
MVDVNSLIGQIIEADCEEVLAQLPDKCVDLVLTDPPYGLGRRMHQGGTWATQPMYDAMEEWDINPASAKAIEEIRRVSKNQIVWGGNLYSLPHSRCWLSWVKTAIPTMADFELAWTSFDACSKKYECARNPEGNGSRVHPTQKPLPLFKWCLTNYSSEGMLVLDPFSGSGTTALACHALNRRFICIEREHEYVEISRNRLRDAQAQMDLFRSAKTESAEAQNTGTQHGQQEIAEVLAEGEL